MKSEKQQKSVFAKLIHIKHVFLDFRMATGRKGDNAAVLSQPRLTYKRICGLMNQNRCCYSSILNLDGLLALVFCAQPI